MRERKQAGAVKRGYDHKRQFYTLVITLMSLSDIGAKSGRSKLMLLKLDYLNINGVSGERKVIPRTKAE